MSSVFLLVYSDELGTREQIVSMLDGAGWLFKTWRYDLPNCVYVVSDLDAKAIAEYIGRTLDPQGKARYVVSEVSDGKYWGRSYNDTWYMFQNKAAAPVFSQPTVPTPSLADILAGRK